MRLISLLIVGALLLSLGTGALAADRFSSAVVFSESGFPAANAAGPSARQFAALLPGAHFAHAGQLATLLKDPATRLLVVTDRHQCAAAGRSLTQAVAAVAGAGAQSVLFREKWRLEFRAELLAKARNQFPETGIQCTIDTVPGHSLS